MTLDTYVGIDQSVGGFGLCFLIPSYRPRLFVQKFPLAKYAREVHQLRAVEDFLITRFGDYHDRIKTVAREGFSYGSTQGREKAGAIAYAVDSTLTEWLPEPACYPLVIAPTLVKKFATGDGSADKAKVKAGVLEHWGNELYDVGAELKDHNAVDAYVIARIAASFDYEDDWYLFDYQKEVLEEIRNPKKKVKKKAAKKLPASAW